MRNGSMEHIEQNCVRKNLSNTNIEDILQSDRTNKVGMVIFNIYGKRM